MNLKEELAGLIETYQNPGSTSDWNNDEGLYRADIFSDAGDYFKSVIDEKPDSVQRGKIYAEALQELLPEEGEISYQKQFEGEVSGPVDLEEPEQVKEMAQDVAGYHLNLRDLGEESISGFLQGIELGFMRRNI
ncbi:hypothetical protein GLU60_02760 [Nanohaloarchaea archaeon H01]|nr:hypothetical protein [Nanohaloarchaea archaeon H01]